MNDSPWSSHAAQTWKHHKLKHVCRIVGGGTPSTGTVEYWQGSIPWVSPKDMKSSRIRDTEDHISEAGLNASATRLIDPGAVLVVMRSGILRHSIPVAVNDVPVALNQDMKALQPDSRLIPEYLARLIEGHQAELLGAWRKEGATVESLEVDLLANTLIPIPSREVQQAIAAYLDRETARLDALIAAKERLVLLLAEKRQALITRAVTRGLNPDARMQDSGISWLGPIPEHWTVERLKYHLRKVEQGWSPQCESVEAEEGEWGVMKAGCVNRWSFDSTENKRLPDTEVPRPEYEIRPGDVLMSRANTTELLGSAALVSHVRPRLLICDKLYRLYVDERRLRKDFLVTFLRSRVGRHAFEREATGASNSMQNIGQDTVRNQWIPIPPEDEQRAIVEATHRQAERLDTLNGAAQRTIELLKERRSALIAAAVTGKIPIPPEPIP